MEEEFVCHCGYKTTDRTKAMMHLDDHDTVGMGDF